MANSCAKAAGANNRVARSGVTARRARIILSLDRVAVAPQIVRIDAAGTAGLVALPPPRLAEQAAPRRLRRIAPVGIARKRPVVVLGIPSAVHLAVAGSGIAAVCVGLVAGDELVLCVDHLAIAVDAEVLQERAAHDAAQALAGGEIDGLVGELALRFARRRAERGARRMIGPGRLDDRLEDRHRDLAAGLPVAERAALAVGIVVA